jgi:hypothetical protein
MLYPAGFSIVLLLVTGVYTGHAADGGDPAKPAAEARIQIDPNSYPAADEKEIGQLRWVIQLANQDPDDFTNFNQVDDQGVSACRYSVAFSAYFLAIEQYHKFPAWRDGVRQSSDRLVKRMLQKRIWQYWEHESPGVTKFEPGMDRPYPPEKDPVAHRNIMYSAHLGQMINLYQMLYNDRKWDAPGSIVFSWDDNEKFVYDNKRLQEVMFLQMMENPVPGIECEPNAIFPACNTHPILSWLLYDKMHGTRFYEAAHPLFDRFFETQFINPKTHQLGAFYLIKQGWTFSSWNPRYGNKMDPVIEGMIKKGVSFDSSGNDGWIGTFMHAWNPKLIEKLYPYMREAQVSMNPDGSATLKNDALTPDAYYGFFIALAAEVGDAAVRDGLLKTIDRQFSPVWKDGTYHYPFIDKVATVNLAADDSGKKGPVATPAATKPEEAGKDAKGGLCCHAMLIKEHGDANNMKTMPQHSDVSDKLVAIARSLPKSGLWTMHNKPFDAEHFSEPAITGVDLKKTHLRRAIYDRENKALIVSTMPSKHPEKGGFTIVNLDPGKTYTLIMDGKKTSDVRGAKEYAVKLGGAKAHDLILIQH